MYPPPMPRIVYPGGRQHRLETTPAAGSLVKPPIAQSRAISARNSLMFQHFQNSKKIRGLCLTEGVPGPGPAFLFHFLPPSR